jgi:hypothetical protein
MHVERERRERDKHEHKGRGREMSASLGVTSTEGKGESVGSWERAERRERGDRFSVRRLLVREVERGSCNFRVRVWSGLLNRPWAF